MCGISGILDLSGCPIGDQGLLRRMADSMTHRGPDDAGTLVDGPLGLGFRRLAIIDIEGGQQPMSTEDGSVSIEFNGEIYNFLELRAELERRGHRFRTRSDTEVVLRGYREWQSGLFDRLDGMFAIAVWDRKRQRLTLARDHMGIKPLYVHDDGVRVRFASEIRAILADPRVRRGLCDDGVRAFLHFGFTPAPLTIFDRVRKVRPGHFVEYTVGGPRRAQERFWRPDLGRVKRESHDAHDRADRYASLVRDAINRQMVSDVPVGCLLSGGVDSAMVLSGMSSVVDDPVKAFTIGFDGQHDFDETELAASTAREFGALHLPSQVSVEAFEGLFERTVRHLEEPVLSDSAFAYLLLNEEVASSVKVVLAGQGVDEPWAGYQRHLFAHYGMKLPQPARRLLRAMTSGLNGSNKLRRGMAAISEPTAEDWLLSTFEVFSAGQLHDRGPLAAEDDRRELGSVVDYWLTDVRHLDPLSQLTYVDSKLSLADDLLLYGDKLSMAASVEVRVPFLSRDLVEFAYASPADAKIRYGRQKVTHKRAAQLTVPKEVIERRKRGFATPLAEWFATDFAPVLRDRLLDGQAVSRQYVPINEIERLLREHTNGAANHRRQLTALISLEMAEEAHASGGTGSVSR